jgi:hypothetical protein
MSDGTPAPLPSQPSGAVTSREATRKNPKQNGFRSGIKIDTNKHGIRRETSNAPRPPKKTGRKKV